MLTKIADWLEGKRTILAGGLITLFATLRALGIDLPLLTETGIFGALGLLVILFRVIAKKKLMPGPAPASIKIGARLKQAFAKTPRK